MGVLSLYFFPETGDFELITLLFHFFSLQHFCLLGFFTKDLRTPKLCKFSWYGIFIYACTEIYMNSIHLNLECCLNHQLDITIDYRQQNQFFGIYVDEYLIPFLMRYFAFVDTTLKHMPLAT